MRFFKKSLFKFMFLSLTAYFASLLPRFLSIRLKLGLHWSVFRLSRRRITLLWIICLHKSRY